MKIVKYTLITIGFALFVYTVTMLCLLGYSAGAILLFLLSGVLVLSGVFLSWLCKHRAFTVVLLVLFALAMVFVILITVFGKTQKASFDSDVVIVLGAQVQGEVPSEHLRSRLDRVLQYVNDDPDMLIVVSGGQGKGESIPEAKAMKDYLVKKGVEESRIIVEDQSRSTFENLANTKMLLKERFDSEYSALIVSSEYHLFRVSLMAKKLGFSASFGASRTKWYEYPYRIARECIAFGKFFLLGE